MRALMTVWRGVRAAVVTRPLSVAATAALALTLQILLPPVILSLARTPWTYFTFNPWLKRLPEFLAGDTPLGQKVDFLTRVALFWFTADGGYGAPDWGFAVATADLVGFVATAALVGVWVALLRRRRDLRGNAGWRGAGRGGGAAGVLAGVLGLSTVPRSVAGCGAPVLPVIGLAFAGLSSGTAAALSTLSQVSAATAIVALVIGITYVGWIVGRDARPRPAP